MTSDLEIAQFGDPTLLQVSAPVEEREFGTEKLINFCGKLMDILKEKSAVGIASPQVKINKRIIAIGCPVSPRRPIPHPFEDKIIINPVVTPLTDEMEEGFEGCLSSGELMGLVPRHQKVLCQGFDPEGHSIEFEAKDLEARVLQHELDHLDGILFFERIENMKSIGFRDALLKNKIL